MLLMARGFTMSVRHKAFMHSLSAWKKVKLRTDLKFIEFGQLVIESVGLGYWCLISQYYEYFVCQQLGHLHIVR